MKYELKFETTTRTKEYPGRPKCLFHILPRTFVELPGKKGFWLFGKKFYQK